MQLSNEGLWDGYTLSQLEGQKDCLCNILNHDGCLNRCLGRLSDRKNPVILHQYGIARANCTDHFHADGFVTDWSEIAYRDGTTKLIAHGCQYSRNGLTYGCKSCGKGGMSVNNTVDIFSMPINVKV